MNASGAATTQSVAVLFTDLVGSTALASRVGPVRAEELRVEHFGLLRGAVVAAGGREIKNLGDGLMVVFASASSALSAGVAMQQAFDARNRSAEEHLEIRVAVSAGEADEDDGDFFGAPVVEAARLCGICEGGQVLTTALVKMFIGARGGFELESLGARELKGFEQPLEVFAVRWRPLTAAKHAEFEVPLPPRLRLPPRAVFAGRAAERARWEEAWKSVGKGDRCVWLVGGEAGIGKTTLVSHLAAASGDDAVVLYGRCDEDLGVPYQPWIEALATLVEYAPDELIVEHASARGAELARLVPSIGARVDVSVPVSSNAEAERYALFGAVVDLLSRAAVRLPVLVVLDDLHWADKSTVHLLRHVAGAVDVGRLMVLGTYRPTDIAVGHPLADAFASLHRQAGVEFVDLAGLDDVELLELMELTAGHEMDDDGVVLRDAIAAETNGNPFFASEVLFHLAESGAILQENGRWVPSVDLAEHGLPVSVRQVVGERVARLGPDAEKLLRTAAVIGRDFELGLLAEVADVDEDDALDILDRAVAAMLVTNVGPDRYSFAHALVEHTLYEDLTPSRRGRTHRRIAAALEIRCGDDPGDRIGELAYHWAAAVAPDDRSKTVDYARRAGDRALAQFAPDEALRWYGQALDGLGSDGDEHLRVVLLVGLGSAQRQVGDPAHRDTLLRAAHAAHDLGDTDLLVAAAIANHRGWSAAGNDRERVAMLDTALAAVGPDDSAQRAQLLAVLSSELALADPVRRDAAAQDAVAIARRLDDPPTLLAALVGHNTSMPHGDVGLCVEAVELAERLDDHVALTHSAATLATVALRSGDRMLFERAVDTCTSSAERVGQPMLIWRSRIGRILRSLVAGDLERAEELADVLLADGIELGSTDVIPVYGGLLASIRFHQGRLPELRSQVEAILEADPTFAVFRAALLAILVLQGDLDTAQRGLEREVDSLLAGDQGDYQYGVTQLSVLAHACARLGDRTNAVPLLARLEPVTGQLENTGGTSTLSTSTCAGMLASLIGRHAEADRYFAEALELATGFRYPFMVASAQLEWARALLERSPAEPDRAQSLLADALVLAGQHGFASIERDAQLLVDTTA